MVNSKKECQFRVSRRQPPVFLNGHLLAKAHAQHYGKTHEVFLSCIDGNIHRFNAQARQGMVNSKSTSWYYSITDAQVFPLCGNACALIWDGICAPYGVQNCLACTVASRAFLDATSGPCDVT